MIDTVRKGIVSPGSALRYGYKSLRERILSLLATPIMAAGWDVLVVIDACRYDLFAEVASDYPYIEDVDSVYSVAANSRTWLERSFGPEYRDRMGATCMVTGNPYSEIVLTGSDFLEYDEVWKYAWDDDVGTIPPRPITDRAIAIHRRLRPDRMLVHYMQPHFPSIPHPDLAEGVDLSTFGENSLSIWERIQSGALQREVAWDAYEDNLRYVMDELELLLENLEAERVVLTADHGNAFGEGGQFGHPVGSTRSVVRKVPWARTTATDGNRYDPPTYDRSPTSTVDGRLVALGYH